MVDYKIVKYCRSCKKRFLVNKGESKNNFCKDCELSFRTEQARLAEEEEKAEKAKAKAKAKAKNSKDE